MQHGKLKDLQRDLSSCHCTGNTGTRAVRPGCWHLESEVRNAERRQEASGEPAQLGSLSSPLENIHKQRTGSVRGWRAKRFLKEYHSIWRTTHGG